MKQVEIDAVRFINTGVEMLLEHYGDDERSKQMVDPIMRAASELVNRKHPNDKMRFSTQLGLIPIEYDPNTGEITLMEEPEGV